MITVTQGELQNFLIDLTTDPNERPYNLTGVTDITVCFQASSTIVTKKLSLSEVTVVNALLGQISVDLLPVDTVDMPSTNGGDIEVLIDFGGTNLKKVKVLRAFAVEETICA